MPGLVGFLSTDKTPNPGATLERMLGCLRHEPFYSSGTLLEADLGLAVGWAVHEGSYSDCLPAWNQTRDVGLIFVGEHFSDGGGVDASELIRKYEEEGPGFFAQLNGIFCGILVDRRAGRAILFNDRYGLGRVYFHESPAGFYFASEAKCLLRVLPEVRHLDPAGLGEFFACGCALENRTLFSGVSLLPGGSKWNLSFRRGVEKASYFEVGSWESQPELPVSEYYEKMRATFTRILPRYLRNHQPVSLSLTGGLDSRMILAGAPPVAGALPCHSFGGMYRECADVRLARQIARVIQQEHTVIPVDAKFFAEFPALAESSVYRTDGAMDVTGAVELFANRSAREIAPVRLTGNYGSEILRGNVAFKAGSPFPGMFDPGFLPGLKSAAVTYANARHVSRTAFIVTKQVPWYHYARLAVEQSQLTVRSPYLDNELVSVAYQAPADPLINKDLAHRYIADGSPALARIPTDRGFPGRPGVPASRFKVFCQEFMPRVEYVFDYGMPQWLAKADRLFAPLHVERLFLGRQKFYHFRVWYRDALSAYVKQVLLDPRSLNRPYLNRRQVESLVTAHTSGRGNFTLEIHKLLTSELIHRRLLELN